MNQLEATSLRLVVRQFTPTYSNVRNEWGIAERPKLLHSLPLSTNVAR